MVIRLSPVMISLSDSDECDWESDMAVQRCLEESLHKDKIYEGYAILYSYMFEGNLVKSKETFQGHVTLMHL